MVFCPRVIIVPSRKVRISSTLYVVVVATALAIIGLGVNYRNHTMDWGAVAPRILRKSDPLPSLGDIGAPLLPRLLSGEQLSATVLVVNDDQTGATPHGRIVPVEATVRGDLNVHGGWLRLIESYHGSGATTPPNLKKIRTYSTGCDVPLPSGIPGRIAPIRCNRWIRRCR